MLVQKFAEIFSFFWGSKSDAW